VSNKQSWVIAQCNPKVGAISENTQQVLAAIDLAQKNNAHAIVFSEMILTGYPADDIWSRVELQQEIPTALQTIAEHAKDILVVLGAPRFFKEKIYNSLYLLKDGVCLGSYDKQCLPNHNVFDECRYFTPGHNSALIFNYLSWKIAFLVCEDFWRVQPVKQVKMSGADLLVVINASPFDSHKSAQRRKVWHEKIAKIQIPVLYVNQVGGYDDLLFDGDSCLLSKKAEVLFQAPLFASGLYQLVIEKQIDQLHYKSSQVLLEKNCFQKNIADSDEARIYHGLVLAVKDYVHKNGFKKVLLGLSGGIDSALTLTIAVDALGADHVEALFMPSRYSSELSYQLAEEQATHLGVHYSVLNIEMLVHAFDMALRSRFQGQAEDATEENIQARIRGQLLMALSNKNHALVLTTGNKSEMAMGYATLYGDMAGGFEVLKDVYKTMVYALSKYRNGLNAEPVIPLPVIHRPPTAELRFNQVDQDSLPPYAVLDQILEDYIEREMSAEQIIAQGADKVIVDTVISTLHRQEYKRQQSALGPRVTTRGFGRDWRFPVAK